MGTLKAIVIRLHESPIDATIRLLEQKKHGKRERKAKRRKNKFSF